MHLRFFTLWRICSHSYILCCEKQWQITPFLLHAPGDLYQLSQLMKSVLFLLSSQWNLLILLFIFLAVLLFIFFNLYLRRPELHMILIMQVYQKFCQLHWSKLPLLLFFFFSFFFLFFFFFTLLSLFLCPACRLFLPAPFPNHIFWISTVDSREFHSPILWRLTILCLPHNPHSWSVIYPCSVHMLRSSLSRWQISSFSTYLLEIPMASSGEVSKDVWGRVSPVKTALISLCCIYGCID